MARASGICMPASSALTQMSSARWGLMSFLHSDSYARQGQVGIDRARVFGQPDLPFPPQLALCPRLQHEL
eukprot:7296864-Lingulodinium_polyedra.AAC.1